jgi:hypothetical protein
MSKNHLKSPPALYFSGALSATLQELLQKLCTAPAFPEHARPLVKDNTLTGNLFRSIVGQPHVKSPNFAAFKTGKGIWQEQSLT